MSLDRAPSSALPPSSTAGPAFGSGPLPPPVPPPVPPRAEPASLGWWAAFNGAVKKLKRQVLALHYANQDPRTGLLPRIFILLALAYALSPIDLIPDFIPVLGLVDDLLILPGLLLLAMWLIPKDVMEQAKQRAEHEPLRLHMAWGTAALVFVLWDGAILAATWWGLGRWGGEALQPHKVWIVAGLGAALLAAEVGWMVAAHRKEARLRGALSAANTQPDLQEALLDGGSQAEYLEP
ncbi:hypothetical protein ABPG75_003610 [Micractinium tetrahymenae]